MSSFPFLSKTGTKGSGSPPFLISSSFLLTKPFSLSSPIDRRALANLSSTFLPLDFSTAFTRFAKSPENLERSDRLLGLPFAL